MCGWVWSRSRAGSDSGSGPGPEPGPKISGNGILRPWPIAGPGLGPSRKKNREKFPPIILQTKIHFILPSEVSLFCLSTEMSYKLLDLWWIEASNSISLDQPAFKHLTQNTEYEKYIVQIPYGKDLWEFIAWKKPFTPVFWANHMTGHWPDDRIPVMTNQMKLHNISCICGVNG